MGPKPTGAASGTAQDPKKRKATPSNGNNRGDSFVQRRAKVHAARHVPSQPAEAAFKDGELNLQAFVAAHEFEIQALEQSMAKSKAVGSSRAFQKVPRGLRRRTASHNPKRVPRRLRRRARREMAEDNTPIVEARRRKPRTTKAKIRMETAKKLRVLAARHKRRKQTEDSSKGNEQEGQQSMVGNGKGKREKQTKSAAPLKPRPKLRRDQLNDPPKPPAKFRKRQINKTWLPTHLWHAKRARMTAPKNPLWRFAIPLTPNEKIYRPTHRAQGDRGAMIWDMSYASTIGVYGNSAGIERVLRNVGITQESCWNSKGSKWRGGNRAWSGFLSQDKHGARNMICPATIIWNPISAQDMEEAANKSPKTQRQLFIRIHPSAFLQVFTELLRLVKSEKPRLHIEDLRFEVGAIELTGPASTEALLSVITPYEVATARSENNHGHVFKALVGLSNPAALPENAVLGFTTQDPRLKYPPRKVEYSGGEEADMKLLELTTHWPADGASTPYALFDRDARHRASSGLPSQKSINRRKGKNEPGMALKPTSADPPIPLILLAGRSVAKGTQIQGTWTLLCPWVCVLPLWYSMVHCPLTTGGNPRFAGMREQSQIALDRGLAWFPRDFPGTEAGAQWEQDQRRERKWAWNRRPKSKRVEWKTLDLGAGRKGEVGNGLACDFEYLFQADSRASPKSVQPSSTAAEPEIEADTEKNGTEPMDVDGEDQDKEASGVASPSSLSFLRTVSRLPRGAAASDTTSKEARATIMTVHITMLSRGVVNPCARIYRLPRRQSPVQTSSHAEVPASFSPTAPLPPDLRQQWLSRVPTKAVKGTTKPCDTKTASSRPTNSEARKRILMKELLAPPSLTVVGSRPNQHEMDSHPLVPGVEDLIGFVTSGEYCLGQGCGTAIGSIAADKVKQDVEEDTAEGKLCIVRNAGESIGRIARWQYL